jgi:hypothetical protein
LIAVKTTLLAVLLLVQSVFCQAIFARLGEDEIQCEERYGFAKKDFATTDKAFPLINGIGATTRTYLYQGWRIRIGFLDGVAVREEYWKITAPGRSVTIADDESKAILEAEKSAGAWQLKGATLTLYIPKMLQDHLQKTLAGTFWIRSDGLATANLDAAKLRLSFESLTAIQHDEEIKRANEEKQRASLPAF